jgi:hypothetical protein
MTRATTVFFSTLVATTPFQCLLPTTSGLPFNGREKHRRKLHPLVHCAGFPCPIQGHPRRRHLPARSADQSTAGALRALLGGRGCCSCYGGHPEGHGDDQAWPEAGSREVHNVLAATRRQCSPERVSPFLLPRLTRPCGWPGSWEQGLEGVEARVAQGLVGVSHVPPFAVPQLRGSGPSFASYWRNACSESHLAEFLC